MATDYKPEDGKENLKQSKSRKFILTSNLNRTFELHIRKSVYIFAPNGSQTVDEFVITHPDFLQQKNNFIISEVK